MTITMNNNSSITKTRIATVLIHGTNLSMVVLYCSTAVPQHRRAVVITVITVMAVIITVIAVIQVIQVVPEGRP